MIDSKLCQIIQNIIDNKDLNEEQIDSIYSNLMPLIKEKNDGQNKLTKISSKDLKKLNKITYKRKKELKVRFSQINENDYLKCINSFITFDLTVLYKSLLSKPINNKIFDETTIKKELISLEKELEGINENTIKVFSFFSEYNIAFNFLLFQNCVDSLPVKVIIKEIKNASEKYNDFELDYSLNFHVLINLLRYCVISFIILAYNIDNEEKIDSFFAEFIDDLVMVSNKTTKLDSNYLNNLIEKEESNKKIAFDSMIENITKMPPVNKFSLMNTKAPLALLSGETSGYISYNEKNNLQEDIFDEFYLEEPLNLNYYDFMVLTIIISLYEKYKINNQCYISLLDIHRILTTSSAPKLKEETKNDYLNIIKRLLNAPRVFIKSPLNDEDMEEVYSEFLTGKIVKDKKGQFFVKVTDTSPLYKNAKMRNYFIPFDSKYNKLDLRIDTKEKKILKHYLYLLINAIARNPKMNKKINIETIFNFIEDQINGTLSPKQKTNLKNTIKLLLDGWLENGFIREWYYIDKNNNLVDNLSPNIKQATSIQIEPFNENQQLISKSGSHTGKKKLPKTKQSS